MPESFFVLSKDNLEIAIDEVISIAKTYDRFAKVKVLSNLVIIQSKTSWDQIAKRATFVKISGQILRKMSGLFLDDENFEVLKKVENQNRPKKIKKYPHELDWKLTRAMINLIGLKEGETVCDPFCGTGTTLLEAESMGIHAIGLDFDEKMYNISKENLDVNGYKSKIIKADFSQLTKIVDEFDGIVTDLPYGTASKSSENPEELIKKFVTILPKRKKIAIMCKKGFEKKLKINPVKKYEIYRHKSLTRTIL